MKMNKEQFLKTEFGGELESTITAWDDALSRNREDKEVLRTLAWCQAQWEVYRMAIKHFYGVEYHFTRTDEYYGLCTEQTVYIRDNGKMLFIYELNSDKLSEEEKIEAVFTLICKIEKPEKGHRYGRKIT